MKKIDLEQGSPEWHEWRSTRWMASEAPVVMGRAPSWFATRTWDDLRIAKMGLAPEPSEFVQARMRRGHELEPVAREWAIEATGHPFEPTCVQGPIGKFAASLDGLATGAWLEVKCVSPEAKWHRNIERDLDIPEYIRWQLLGQWAALGKAPLQCYLVIWDENHSHYTRIIGVDIEELSYEKKSDKEIDLVNELQIMWKSYESLSNSSWTYWAEKWRRGSELRKAAQESIDEAAAELLKIADGRDMQGDGVSAKIVTRQGSVDWKKMARAIWEGDEHHFNEMTEEYRRPSTTSPMIRATKYE